MLPQILGAAVIGGILYLFTNSEEGDDNSQSEEVSRQQAAESQLRIRELRRQLRKEVKERNKALRHLQPVESEDNSD